MVRFHQDLFDYRKCVIYETDGMERKERSARGSKGPSYGTRIESRGFSIYSRAVRTDSRALGRGTRMTEPLFSTNNSGNSCCHVAATLQQITPDHGRHGRMNR